MADAWLLLRPEIVPDELRLRAVPVSLVMLRPGETVMTGSDGGRPVLVDEDELALARLAAKGLPHADIATMLDVSPRTVERRLSRLRDRLGARSAAELAAALSRRGLS